MDCRRFKTLLASIVVLSCAFITVPSQAQLELCYAECATSDQVSIFTTPDGLGNTFLQAYLYGGVETDATITLHMIDQWGNPIANYPREDLWLETTLDGLVGCIGGTNADSATDENGETHWQNALHAGGQTVPDVELTRVIINGDPLETSEGFAVQFNSADMDGSGAANLTDITSFTQILLGEYDYAADFLWDGLINLPDVVLMAQGNGAQCP